MDERRDPPPDAGTRRPPIATAGRLSPLQQAWGRYVSHTTECAVCRDVDRGRCETSEQLYEAWRGGSESALRRLGQQRGNAD